MTKHPPRTSFKITARQARDLVAITPDGYVAEVRVAFLPQQEQPEPKTAKGDECDGVFGTDQSG